MEDSKDVGTLQWYVLLGAMLASKDARASAIKAFVRPDVPQQFLTLWDALASKDGKKVWEAVSTIGVPMPLPDDMPGATVIGRLTCEMQERALKAYIAKQVASADFIHKAGLGPDAVADTFESVAASIRVRQGQIAKANQPAAPPATPSGKDSNGQK